MPVVPRSGLALATLAVILVITVAWWALALWPVDTATAPAWLTLTRDVCFGATGSGLPSATGWMLLIGQPLGMVLLLFVVWGRDVRDGLRRVAAQVVGQLVVGATLAVVLAGIALVVVRVRSADAQPFASSDTERLVGKLTRLNETPPVFSLVDQAGATVTLDRFRGRPVIVTFAYGHCETVCPLVVSDVLLARRRLAARDPVVLVLTLDPWRDTPGRLPAMAAQWGLSGDEYVVSGAPDTVERALNAWRIPRVRNERTGDLVHPTIVYVIGANGRIAYVLGGSPAVIQAAVEAL